MVDLLNENNITAIVSCCEVAFIHADVPDDARATGTKRFENEVSKRNVTNDKSMPYMKIEKV